MYLELPATPASYHSRGDDVPDGDGGARLHSVSDCPLAIASQPYMNQYGVADQRMRIRRLVQRRRMRVAMRDGREGEPGVQDNPRRHKVGELHHGAGQLHLQARCQLRGPDHRRSVLRRAGEHPRPAGDGLLQGLWGWNNNATPAPLRGGGPQYNPTTVTGTVGRGVCPPTWRPHGERNRRTQHRRERLSRRQRLGRSVRDPRLGRRQLRPYGLELHRRRQSSSLGTYAGGGPTNLTIASKFSAANIGSTYKASVKNYYLPTKTTVTLTATQQPSPVTTHYHDLDPHYTDLYGDPLSRVTADGVDQNNYNLNAYITPLLAPILTKMGASNVTLHAGAASLAAAGHTTRPGRVISPQGRHAHGCEQQHLDAEHVPAVLDSEQPLHHRRGGHARSQTT